ncbi:MAG: protein-glutamate O-methyltransferase [Chromatiaceae bacterium]|nr:protein-glutamate O-methyltransferase [Gammaproteobacteria bacterium]MCP5414642.1 protein-glutamate O-methyltransferase [Chromatiaceae bacterium]MCP5421995.1 protein-glutamate O-methyltransferase [Chromatiaceae bacterium]
MTAAREYEFTRRDFDYLRRISNQHTGIVVTDDKFDMFYSRLARRVRALGLSSFADYCDYLDKPAHEGELVELVNALTTNLTSFFRENHHFEFLAHRALPSLVEKNRSTRSLRIWSAGCSTGEEPYSLAITLRENQHLLRGWDAQILASDIDSNVLSHAQAGIYAASRVEGMSKQRLKSFFLKGTGSNLGKVRVRPELHNGMQFKLVNLMHKLPVEQQDVIFCRNVIIYFDKDTKRQLLNKFADALSPHGYLFVGHSESLHQVTDRFKLIGNTVYEKVR